jgi:hypothetical protein
VIRPDIDLGIGLAKNADRVPRRPQCPFSGLLVGGGLFHIVLRHGARFVEFPQTRQIASRQLEHTSGGDQV